VDAEILDAGEVGATLLEPDVIDEELLLVASERSIGFELDFGK
jgi:hypothetical protein